jgi:hypothetical protein
MPLSVPKIRFCNNSDEVRRGRAQMKEALIRAALELIAQKGAAGFVG